MLANINMSTSCGPQGHQEGDGSGFFCVYLQKKRKSAFDWFGLRNLTAALLTHKCVDICTDVRGQLIEIGLV